MNEAQIKNIEVERNAYELFNQAYRNYRSIHQEVRDISRLNSNAQALTLSTEQGRIQFDAAEATLKQLVKKADSEMSSTLLDAESAFITSRNTTFIIALVALIFAVAVAFFIVRILYTRTQMIAERAQQIAIGVVLGEEEEEETQDELSVIEESMRQINRSSAQIVELASTLATGAYGDRLEPRSTNDPLVDSLNRMSEGMTEASEVAATVARGDYRAEITPRSDQDVLGNAMRQMLLSLREVSNVANAVVDNDFSVRVSKKSDEDQLAPVMNQMIESLGVTLTENQSQNWVQQGVVSVGSATSGEQRFEELAAHAITALCEYLGMQVGALYIVRSEEEKGKEGEKRLHLLGSYAYTERKNLSNVFKFGESLVGQAALENQPIVVQQVPDDYIKVSSGLGESTPQNVIVYPFSFEGEVRGVIELGSVDALNDDQREVLNRVADGLGIAFQSAIARAELDKALKESQSFAEELQTQQEELQETNEQLEEQTQALERTQRDVEERNRRLVAAQEELNERAEQLSQSSKYKSEFLANMSHELRTPLNSILLLSKMLAGGGVEDDEEQRLNAQVIHDAGSDLLGLINEVLDLSKIEAGKMAVHFSTINIQEFANSFKALFRPQAIEKELGFEVEVDPNLPATFRSDRDRVQQVLRNFLSNAMKFTAQGGISVKVEAVNENLIRHLVAFSNLREVLRSRPQDYLVFSVVDSGLGIPEEKRQLVFEAFQQADGSTSRNYGGTGLGLSISSQIADMLEGALALQSSVGAEEHGSIFSIVIPLSPSAAMNAVAETSYELEQEVAGPSTTLDVSASSMGESVRDDQMVTSPKDERILLVVEDDPRFAHTLIDLGRKHEFKVVHAATGTEGVRLAEHYLPTAILLDIQLPIMDGWGVIRHLKKNPGTSHIPVHIMSVIEEAQFGYRLGAAQYLTKPVDPEQLEDAFTQIEGHLSGKMKHLLVVEDNQIERESIIKLLSCGKDIQCEGVGSGAEALEVLRSNRFDAFILDLRLPDMSGYEVLQAVSEDTSIERVPVIVYTGKDLSLEEEKKLRAYAESIVLKTAESPARLLEETTIFLHRVRADLSEDKQQLLSEVSHVDDQFHDRTILLVDDDIRNTFALSSILEKRGLKILTAADGQEALDMLDQHQHEVELVLMDIMMPVMDGYEATRKIREQQQFEKLPVIALTAKALREDRDLCIAAGASDYMTKPIDYDQLFSLIRVWLSTMSQEK